MYGLPRSTEMNRPIPKKAIYDKFGMNTGDRAKFDADIRKLAIVSEISPSTVNIAAGETIAAFYVIQVSLRRQEYDPKTIIMLSKLIDQNLLFVLEYDNMARLAVYHTKIIQSEWSSITGINVILSGLNLDAAWESIILNLSGIQLDQGNTLDKQLVINEELEKLRRQIEKLEKQARNEKQPRKKFELVQELRRLKYELDNTEVSKIEIH